MKTAIIDAGGGMKGAWGAGVVEYLLDEGISFDIAIGVSAGSSNLVTLKSKQKGRLIKFYRDYPSRPEYMGLGQFLKNHTFFNVKYIFEDLSLPGMEGEIDVEEIERNPMDLYIVATDAETGRPVYFNPNSFNPSMHEASCNIPIMNVPVEYEGHSYYDGGISDPIPWKKAFELGAERVVAVLTRPITLLRDPTKDMKLSRILRKKLPNAAEALATRGLVYNLELEEMKEEVKKGRVLIIAPDDTCGVTTTKHKAEDVEALYEKAYRESAKIKAFLAE